MRRVRAEQQARWTRQMIESARPIVADPPAVINEVALDEVGLVRGNDDDGLGFEPMDQDNDDFQGGGGGEDELSGVFGQPGPAVPLNQQEPLVSVDQQQKIVETRAAVLLDQQEPLVSVDQQQKIVETRAAVPLNQQEPLVNDATRVIVELHASSPVSVSSVSVPPVGPVVKTAMFAFNDEEDRVVDDYDIEAAQKRDKQRKAELAAERKREREETRKQKEEERLLKQQEKEKAKKAKTEVRKVKAIPREQLQQQQQFIPPIDLPLGVREGSLYNPYTVPDSPRNGDNNNNNNGPIAVLDNSLQVKLHDLPANDLLQTNFMAAAKFPQNMIEAVLNTDVNALSVATHQSSPVFLAESPFQWSDYDVSELPLDFVGENETLIFFTNMGAKEN